MRKIVLFFLILVNHVAAQAAAKDLPIKPEEGKAIVYVIRPSFLPHYGVEIYLDGREKSAEVGMNRGKHYIYFNVNPGKHTLYSNAMNWAELAFEVKENDSIYILQDVTGFGPLSTSELLILSAEEGLKKLKNLSFGFVNLKNIQAINSGELSKQVANNSDIPGSAVPIDTKEKPLANNDAVGKKSSIPEKKLSDESAIQKPEEAKRSRERATNGQRLNLLVSNSQPDVNGAFSIIIKTNSDTASLKIDGVEEGGRADGNYSINRIARAGQTTQYKITATDIFGNTDTKTIAVTRQLTASNQFSYAELNPAHVKSQASKDAVAIIIGIADYKKLPKADFSNDDARLFYDYAIRGLGVKAENIKLLVDADAEQGEIYKVFKSWLPARVKATTDVYVYYSGHGLPAADGQSFYLLPHLADRDLIEETAISHSKINAAIQSAKPRSVTIFLDSCYSGSARTGQTLLASARPVSLKANTQVFPAEFTVITASTADQISSSSPELKHGIFSYYLMKGMEGEADSNKDGKITAGEMHSYLTENVARQASLVNRVQQPQLTGDANRVLVGR